MTWGEHMYTFLLETEPGIKLLGYRNEWFQLPVFQSSFSNLHWCQPYLRNSVALFPYQK